MALMVMTASYLLLNSGNLSSYCKKIDLTVDVDEKDSTTFGSSGWKAQVPGLMHAQLSVDLDNDYAAGNLDSILWPLLGTIVAFEVRAVNTSRSTSNPAYTGNCHVKSLKPISGAVGDLAAMSVTWSVSGQVSRLTA